MRHTSTADRWAGKSTIYGEGDKPYMTRHWIGRLRLHVFHRGDQGPDCHDHPWDFWTFPFQPYVEEVVDDLGPCAGYETRRQVVPSWRPTFRPANHCHRVLNRVERVDLEEGVRTRRSGQQVYMHGNTIYRDRPGPLITLVWRGKAKRPWGFLKNRDGRWCWVAWKEYVFGGGKHAPCE